MADYTVQALYTVFSLMCSSLSERKPGIILFSVSYTLTCYLTLLVGTGCDYIFSLLVKRSEIDSVILGPRTKTDVFSKVVSLYAGLETKPVFDRIVLTILLTWGWGGKGYEN